MNSLMRVLKTRGLQITVAIDLSSRNPVKSSFLSGGIRSSSSLSDGDISDGGEVAPLIRRIVLPKKKIKHGIRSSSSLSDDDISDGGEVAPLIRRIVVPKKQIEHSTTNVGRPVIVALRAFEYWILRKTRKEAADEETPTWLTTSQQMEALLWQEEKLDKWLRKAKPKLWNPAEEGDVPRFEDLRAKLVQQRSSYIEAKDRCFDALDKSIRLRDPHQVLKGLVEISNLNDYGFNEPLIGTIRPNTFSEILRLLDPVHFFGKHGELRKEFSPHFLRVLRVGSIDVNGFHQFYVRFLRYIHRIFLLRRQTHSTSSPNLSDYKYLLKAARWSGNKAMAVSTWIALTTKQDQDKLKAAKRIVPDTECFNHYMATICWADVLNPLHAHHLRIMPRNLNLRQWEKAPRSHTGHQVGPERGIKVVTSYLFRSMVKYGLVADEHTFCMLMIAASREADLKMAEGILDRVWNVHSDEVLSGTDVLPNKDIFPDSPLYPSKELLLTIAHIYGINNSIPTALSLLDHISRKYSIKIDSEVWVELLKWTRVLSEKRTGAAYDEKGVVIGAKRDVHGTAVGQLPQAAVSNVWEIMTSEPYNIKPTMRMYNFLIGILLRSHRFGEAQLKMIDAWRLHQKAVLILKRKQLPLIASSNLKPHSAMTARYQRDCHYQLLRVQRNRAYIRNWVYRLIKRGSRSLVNNQAFVRQNVPETLKRWRSFVPQKIEFETDTGIINLRTNSKQYNRLRILRRTFANPSTRQRRSQKVLSNLLERREKKFLMEREAANSKPRFSTEKVQDDKEEYAIPITIVRKVLWQKSTENQPTAIPIVRKVLNIRNRAEIKYHAQ